MISNLRQSRTGNVAAAVCLSAACLINAPTLSAQTAGTLGETNVRLFTVSGNVSVQAHGYTTDRDFNRREPLGALTTANLAFSVLGFRSGLNLRYSTDDSRFRQSMNQFSFSGSWRWLTLSAGDVSPNHSRYGMSGTRIRGGEIQITPGRFRFEAGVGQANRAVDLETGSGFRRPSYERWLYTGKIGYGSQAGSYFNLSGLYGRDLASGGIISGDDTMPVAGGVPLPTPAENLSLTPDFQISMFNKAFRIGAQTTFSAYSRDTRSPALGAEDGGVPSWIVDLFRPRVSTRVSFAGQAQTELNVDPFQLRVGYERIQPGFESMGLRQLRDDQELWTFQPRLYLFNNRFSIDSSIRFGRDNLLGNRLFTQKRQDLSVNTRTQVTNQFSLGLGYNRNENRTEAGDDGGGLTESDQSQISQMFQFQPVLVFFSGTTSHSISLAGVYQSLEARLASDYLQRNTGSSTITGVLSYGMALQTGLSLTASANMLSGEAAGSDFTAFGVTLGSGYSFFERKLNLNLTGGFSQNTFNRPVPDGTTSSSTSSQFNASLNANYRVTAVNSLRLSLRALNNRSAQIPGQGFSELEARIQFDHRF
jgi:hypothetical protein